MGKALHAQGPSWANPMTCIKCRSRMPGYCQTSPNNIAIGELEIRRWIPPTHLLKFSSGFDLHPFACHSPKAWGADGSHSLLCLMRVCHGGSHTFSRPYVPFGLREVFKIKKKKHLGHYWTPLDTSGCNVWQHYRTMFTSLELWENIRYLLNNHILHVPQFPILICSYFPLFIL